MPLCVIIPRSTVTESDVVMYYNLFARMKKGQIKNIDIIYENMIGENMDFKYTKLTSKKAYMLRNNFIKNFVDTSHQYYIKFIQNLKADDVLSGIGFTISFMWNCLNKNNRRTVEFYSAIRYLYGLKKERVFVMWDIRPRKLTYPGDCHRFHTFTYECERLLKSDEVISIDPKELCEVLLHDNHIREHWIMDISKFFLREDLYIFDETFTWYIATTHESKSSNYDKRLILSNVPEIKELAM